MTHQRKRGSRREIGESSRSHFSGSAGEDKSYEVEGILAKKITYEGDVEYLVLWKGYKPDQATWEPPENCASCEAVVDRFERSIDEFEKARRSKFACNGSSQNSIQESDDDVLITKSKPATKNPSQKPLKPRRRASSGDSSTTDIDEKPSGRAKLRSRRY